MAENKKGGVFLLGGLIAVFVVIILVALYFVYLQYAASNAQNTVVLSAPAGQDCASSGGTVKNLAAGDSYCPSQFMCGIQPAFCTVVSQGQTLQECLCGAGQCFDGQKCISNGQPTGQVDTTGWSVYNDTANGITFKYPAGFNSKYASFQSNPVATIATSGSTNIDSKGCYVVANSPAPTESQVTINSLQFCLSASGDPGAGQLYNTSNYTTLRNGKYITLQYVVHTLNGCGPYAGTADATPCNDFMNNYATNVTGVIQNSVSTLQFTK